MPVAQLLQLRLNICSLIVVSKVALDLDPRQISVEASHILTRAKRSEIEIERVRVIDLDGNCSKCCAKLASKKVLYLGNILICILYVCLLCTPKNFL